jgi:hypothetical protein
MIHRLQILFDTLILTALQINSVRVYMGMILIVDQSDKRLYVWLANDFW